MTREEFIERAKECGYTRREIENLLKIHDEGGIPYQNIFLDYRCVD